MGMASIRFTNHEARRGWFHIERQQLRHFALHKSSVADGPVCFHDEVTSNSGLLRASKLKRIPKSKGLSLGCLFTKSKILTHVPGFLWISLPSPPRLSDPFLALEAKHLAARGRPQPPCTEQNKAFEAHTPSGAEVEVEVEDSRSLGSESCAGSVFLFLVFFFSYGCGCQKSTRNWTADFSSHTSICQG